MGWLIYDVGCCLLRNNLEIWENLCTDGWMLFSISSNFILVIIIQVMVGMEGRCGTLKHFSELPDCLHIHASRDIPVPSEAIGKVKHAILKQSALEITCILFFKKKKYI